MSNKILVVILALAIMTTSVWYINVAEAGIVTKGLVSFWTLDESDIENGVVKDIYGNNDGTIKGSPQIVGGKIEEALDFNGSSDYIVCAEDPSLDITDKISIEAWVKIDTIQDSYIVGKRDGGNQQYASYCNPDGAFRFVTWGGDTSVDTAANVLVTGQWYHLVAVYDSATGTGEMYVNGVPSAADATASPITAAACGVHIGARGDGAGGSAYPLDGIIDEVKIYNRILSEDEVVQNYNAESNLFAAVEPGNKLAVTWGRIRAED